MRKTIGTVVAVLALCALALPAAAATGGTPPSGVRFTGDTSLIHLAPVRLPATHLPHPAHARRLMSGETLAPSANWSGYADTACSTCAFRFVSTQFTVPAINCTVGTTSGKPSASFWDGLDGYADSTVEQVGVDATCLGSTPKYFGWYEMFPSGQVTFSITGFGPGDAVRVNVYFNATTHQYQLTFDDITQGTGFVASQSVPVRVHLRQLQRRGDRRGAVLGRASAARRLWERVQLGRHRHRPQRHAWQHGRWVPVVVQRDRHDRRQRRAG